MLEDFSTALLCVYSCCFIQRTGHTYSHGGTSHIDLFWTPHHTFVVVVVRSLSNFCFTSSNFQGRYHIVAHSYGAFTKGKALCRALHIALLTGGADTIISASPGRGETLMGYWIPVTFIPCLQTNILVLTPLIDDAFTKRVHSVQEIG